MSFAIAFSASAAAIGTSGMRAAQVQLDTSAHNVANVQTPGFQRQQVQLATQPAPGGVNAQVGQASAPLAQGSDGFNRLAEDRVAQRISLYSFTANLRTVQTQDATLGTLLDVRA
jgi:flagellar hook protein FlgE